MSDFFFDEALHRYTLDGEEIPGVTRILQDMGMNDTEWFRDHHRKRGTAVHLAAELAAQDRLDIDATHPKIAPYATQFIKWKERVNYRPILMEKALHSKTWRFAGKLDHFGLIEWEGDDRPCLIDVKSGGVPPSIGLQLILYRQLLKENAHEYTSKGYMISANDILVASLQLNPDKFRFRVIEEDRLDSAMALGLVRAWYFRQQHKLLKGQE